MQHKLVKHRCLCLTNLLLEYEWMRKCNVFREFKCFEVNFTIWIIIWRIFKMVEIY